MTTTDYARILWRYRYWSRRWAKAELRTITGSNANAEQLDEVLREIEQHPERAAIEAETMRLHVENAAEDRVRRKGT
jgi:hypothetical protein